MKCSKSVLGGCLTGLVILCMMNTSTAYAQVRRGQETPAWLRSWTPPQVPDGYRSPVGPHKLMVHSGDTAQLSVLRRISPLAVVQYHQRSLYVLSNEALDGLPPQQLQQLNIQDDQNLIRLRDRFFDTTVPQADLPQGMQLAPRLEGQLHLVQFIGPVQDDWLAGLRQSEGLQIVTYIPENAYLVWANQSARDELAAQSSFQPHVQWEGPFHPAYKLHPGFDLVYDGHVQATIQLFTHTGVDASINTIREKASSVLKEPRQVGVYTNITIEVPASELENIARLEDVVNIEPFVEPSLGGERQGQILRNQMNAAGSQPTGPG